MRFDGRWQTEPMWDEFLMVWTKHIATKTDEHNLMAAWDGERWSCAFYREVWAAWEEAGACDPPWCI